MKNKLLKIFFSILTIFTIYTIFTTVKAVSIKENVSDYNTDVYLIGGTKFDGNITVTSTRAARAGIDQTRIDIAHGKEISDKITTYYYNSLFGEWYELEGENFEILNSSEVKEVEDNLDVFFVNNEEKVLEYEYNGTVDENSIDTEGITYDGSKFKVPATKFSFKFKSNGTEKKVVTTTEVKDGEKEIDYGSFYIPYDVEVYDAEGTKLCTVQTIKGDFINKTGLFDYTKEGYKLTYVDEAGETIDFETTKITKNGKIYQKWIPEGTLAIENSTYENETLTYHGILYLNSKNKNQITVKLYAPEGYDTKSATIEGQTGTFDELKNEEGYVEISLTFGAKDEIQTIKVKWEEGVESELKVAIGEDAKFERLIQYANSSNKFTTKNREKVIDGEIPKGLEVPPTKSGYALVGWSLEKEGEPYDMSLPVTSNIKLYPIFKQAPKIDFINGMKNFKLRTPTEFTVKIAANAFANETIYMDANLLVVNPEKTSQYLPIEYDENNYLQVLVNGKWQEFKDVPIKLSEAEENTITYKILLTDEKYSSASIRFAYEFKQEGKKIYEGYYGSARAIAEEDIVAEANGGYYTEASITGFQKTGTVKLHKDITLNRTWSFTFQGQDIIIDLNGHTITAENKDLFQVTTNKTSLTIKNGNLVVKGKKQDKSGNEVGAAAILIGQSKTAAQQINVTVENDVNITADDYGIGIFGNGPVLDFKGKLNVKNEGAFGITSNANPIGQNTTINIHEGAQITANEGYCFYLPQNGTLNVYGGELTANTVIGVKSGIVNIMGGTLTATGEKAELQETGNGIEVTGDTIYIEVNTAYARNISINITGGTLTSNNGNKIQIFKSNIADSDLEIEPNIVNVQAPNYEKTVDENNIRITRYN